MSNINTMNPVDRVIGVLGAPTIEYEAIIEIVALWDKLSTDDQEMVRLATGGPKPDIEAIHASLLAGTADYPEIARQLSKWWAFVPSHEFEASLVALIEGLKLTHASDENQTTPMAMLQHEMLHWPHYVFATTRLGETRRRDLMATLRENPVVDALATRLTDADKNLLGKSDVDAIARALNALDDATLADVGTAVFGVEPPDIETVLEDLGKLDMEGIVDSVVCHLPVVPLADARRLVAAIPSHVISTLQELGLWQVGLARLRLAGA